MYDVLLKVLLLLQLDMTPTDKVSFEFDWSVRKVDEYHYKKISWPRSEEVRRVEKRIPSWVVNSEQFRADQSLLENVVQSENFNLGLTQLLEFSYGIQAYAEYNRGEIAVARATIVRSQKYGRGCNRILSLVTRLRNDADVALDKAAQFVAEGNVQAAHCAALKAILCSDSKVVRDRAADVLEVDASIQALSFLRPSVVDLYLGATLLQDESDRTAQSVCAENGYESNTSGITLRIDPRVLGSSATNTPMISDMFDANFEQFLPGVFHVHAVDSTHVQFRCDYGMERYLFYGLRTWRIPNSAAFARVDTSANEVHYRRQTANTNVSTIHLKRIPSSAPEAAVAATLADRPDLAFVADLSEEQLKELDYRKWQRKNIGKIRSVVVFCPVASLSRDQRYLIQIALGDSVNLKSLPSEVRGVAANELKQSKFPAPVRICSDPESIAHQPITTLFNQVGLPYEGTVPMNLNILPKIADYDICAFDTASDSELFCLLAHSIGVFRGFPTSADSASVAEWMRRQMWDPVTQESNGQGEKALIMLRTFGMAADLGITQRYVLMSPRVRGSLATKLHVLSSLRDSDQ